jgi:hypothetical protein
MDALYLLTSTAVDKYSQKESGFVPITTKATSRHESENEQSRAKPLVANESP